MWNGRIVAAVVLLAALVGCSGSTPTGDAGTTLSSTIPPSSVPQPPALTFTERERAPREFAKRDALDCLRAGGLTESGQPFDPAISGPAWRQCHTAVVAYLEVARPSPEPVDTLMAMFDCMADQGFIELFPSPGNDSQQYGQAQGYCGGNAPSGAGLLVCDVYRVGADGTIGTSPTRTGVEQLITVEATAPTASTVGTPFAVTIRPYTLTMPPTLYGVTVIDGSAFVRAFTVEGGSIDPASLRSAAPTEPDVAVSTESDGTTATFRYDSVVPATESIEFPEATFEVAPSAPGHVGITFSGYEQSITFDVDGELRVVQTVCTSRFGTPVAWSDAT